MCHPPKNQLFTHFARVAKALASPVRLELLEALGQGEHSVDELARAVRVPMANASHHLQVLRDGGLVHSRRDGVQIIYSLTDETEIIQVIAGIRRIAEAQLAEVDRIVREAFTSRDSLTPMDPREVMKLARRREVTVIDVRPRAEFHAGHVKGAINVPLEKSWGSTWPICPGTGRSSRIAAAPIAYCPTKPSRNFAAKGFVPGDWRRAIPSRKLRACRWLAPIAS